MEGLAIFAGLTRRMGRGEAACLALGETRRWCVASDENKVFCRKALVRLGKERILTTAGLIRLAIRADLLTIEQADAIQCVLERKASVCTLPALAISSEPKSLWRGSEIGRDVLHFSSVAGTVAEIIVEARGRPISIGRPRLDRQQEMAASPGHRHAGEATWSLPTLRGDRADAENGSFRNGERRSARRRGRAGGCRQGRAIARRG